MKRKWAKKKEQSTFTFGGLFLYILFHMQHIYTLYTSTLNPVPSFKNDRDYIVVHNTQFTTLDEVIPLSLSMYSKKINRLWLHFSTLLYILLFVAWILTLGNAHHNDKTLTNTLTHTLCNLVAKSPFFGVHIALYIIRAAFFCIFSVCFIDGKTSFWSSHLLCSNQKPSKQVACFLAKIVGWLNFMPSFIFNDMISP